VRAPLRAVRVSRCVRLNRGSSSAPDPNRNPGSASTGSKRPTSGKPSAHRSPTFASSRWCRRRMAGMSRYRRAVLSVTSASAAVPCVSVFASPQATQRSSCRRSPSTARIGEVELRDAGSARDAVEAILGSLASIAVVGVLQRAAGSKALARGVRTPRTSAHECDPFDWTESAR
jgi:hypothetical protein